MDKPDKKDVSETPATSKKSSALDDILGGGFGSDDLGFNLDLDLDQFLGTSTAPLGTPDAPAEPVQTEASQDTVQVDSFVAPVSTEPEASDVSKAPTTAEIALLESSSEEVAPKESPDAPTSAQGTAPTEDADTPSALSSQHVEMIESAPKAELPSPPEDLKELIEIPSPQMPEPPQDLSHDVELPEQKLSPPPEQLSGLLGSPTLNPPPQDLKATLAEESDIQATLAEQATEIATQEEQSGHAATVSADIFDTPVAVVDPLSDSVSSSKSELAAIQSATPVASGPQGAAKQTQMYGSELGESLQKELNKIAASQETAAVASAPEIAATMDNEAIFPPSEPSVPSTGTADFAAVDVDTAASTTPSIDTTKPVKKKANPLMQTALYGSEMDDLQKQLIQQAAQHLDELAGTQNTDAKEETKPEQGKQTHLDFQTQMYGANEVAEAVQQLAQDKSFSENDFKSTVMDMDAEPAFLEASKRPAVRVQIDPTHTNQTKRPVDSLFDDPSGAEAIQQIAAEAESRQTRNRLEAQAENAVQEKNLVTAIKIYHQLQQMYPEHQAYDGKLKQLVAMHKNAQAAPGAQPSPFHAPSEPAAPSPSPQPQAPKTQSTKPAKPTKRPAKPKQKSGNTLNLILAVILVILVLVLASGLIWPGWLKKKTKPTVPNQKASKVAPLTPGVGSKKKSKIQKTAVQKKKTPKADDQD